MLDSFRLELSFKVFDTVYLNYVNDINTTMRIDELTMPQTFTEAKDRLEDAGYRELGSGYYGSVFQKPGAPYVLKLFSSDDRAYKEFVKMALRSKNNHFPRFKKGLVRINNGFVAIRMEPLEKLPTDDYVDFYMIDRFFSHDRREMNEEDITDFISDEYGEEFLSALGEIKDLISHNKGMIDDLHQDNIMLRGNTLVITDPVS